MDFLLQLDSGVKLELMETSTGFHMKMTFSESRYIDSPLSAEELWAFGRAIDILTDSDV